MEYIGSELDLFKDAIVWKKYFSSQINQYISGDVLEVGAGLGANSKFLINDKVISWTFLEPDHTLCNKIKINTTDINISKNVINGTIDSTNCTFDTIIYIDVLEHIEDSMGEIDKIKTRLNKGGNLIILVPAYQYLFSDFDREIGHFRRYNKKVLKNEVKDKLVLVSSFYLDSIGVLASLVNKIFLKKAKITRSQVSFWDNYLVRISYLSDIIFFRKFGKSLIAIFTKE